VERTVHPGEAREKRSGSALYFPNEVTNAVYARPVRSVPEPRHDERHGSLPGPDRRQVPRDVDDGARRDGYVATAGVALQTS